MKSISTELAPAAIGVYSQAIAVGKIVYLSGQIPLSPHHSTLVSEDFTEQTAQVFKNLKAVAQAAGGDLSRVVKINAYLTDFDNYSTFNQVMSSFFQPPYPARAVVGVKQLPKNALVEVEATMILD